MDSKIARMETCGEERIPVNIFADDDSDWEIKDGTPCDIEVFGTADDIEVFDSEEAFAAHNSIMAPISMIPSGTFSSESSEQSPHIIFSGKVIEVEKDPNAEENQPNYCLNIDSHELRFCLFVRYGGEIAAGNIVSGEAWIYADIIGK